MEINCILKDIQVGLFTVGLEGPLDITISTFDLDLTMFITEFYDPNNTYDIWYWYIDYNYNKDNVPSNIHLHQLEKNHAKFWYLQGKHQSRFVITSANMTRVMVHGWLQSFISITCEHDSVTLTPQQEDDLIQDYNRNMDKFFGTYNTKIDIQLYSMLKDRLIYNIPQRVNGIERWLKMQDYILVDSNNINMAYLPTVKKAVVIRKSVPAANKIISYYNTDTVNSSTEVVSIPYTQDFHYKIYYTSKCTLISSNNFSYNHKNNYELGILITNRDK